jgi:hypothetical protein
MSILPKSDFGQSVVTVLGHYAVSFSNSDNMMFNYSMNFMFF